MRLLQPTLFASLLAFLTAGCTPEVTTSAVPETAPTASSVTSTIVIADISDEPAKQIELFQPFANYLAGELDQVGIEAGLVEVAPDMETMAAWLASGKVDVYFDSPYPAMVVADLSGAQPVLRRWKDGVESYNSIIFTRADSGIQSLDDLTGEIIAFEEPFSTSGYMLPFSYLIEAGLQPVEAKTTEATVSPADVSYVFSGDAENTIQWVLTGRVGAAAVGATDFLEIPEEVRQQLVVLAETESVPRHLVMLSPTLTPEEVEAIKAALMEMDETEAGQAILAGFEETAQFDAFPEGTEQGLSRIRQLYELAQP